MIERSLTMVSAGRLGGGAEASESWRCGQKGRGRHQFRATSPSTRPWQQVSGDSRQQDQVRLWLKIGKVYVMASPEVEGFLGDTTCASISWNKSDSWEKKQNIERQRRTSHQSPGGSALQVGKHGSPMQVQPRRDHPGNLHSGYHAFTHINPHASFCQTKMSKTPFIK